jgi:hypothetical protein
MFRRQRQKLPSAIPTVPIGPTGPTGAAPPVPSGTVSGHPAEQWPKIFWVLEYVEFWLVCFIAFFLVALTLYLAVWIFFGCGPQIHDRLVQTIKGVNTAWKIALLILIPLFFRPVFKFLFYLKQGPLGTARDELKPSPEVKRDAYTGSSAGWCTQTWQ